MNKRMLICWLLCLSTVVQAQLLTEKKQSFTKSDSLKGGLTIERTCYDVKSYDLSVKVIPAKKFIVGCNKMDFIVKKATSKIQIDLFENMDLDSAVFQSEHLSFTREYNAIFLSFPKKLPKSKDTLSIALYFSGHPIEAKNPPWDGGFVFRKDEQGKDWISVAVQGMGASAWFPCKDHPSDEADRVEVTIETPAGLMGISNGRLINEETLENGNHAYTWRVSQGINNYNITLYIGNYVHFSDHYKDLDLDYYVLPQHLAQAKKQFTQVQSMLTCFESKIGPYPFLEDGYKIVEAPYLGMEHQSAIAYGNHFENGYLGKDLSGTGWGLEWDFIIIHESGHEWFGNSISASDIADMWIHESLTTYTESIYVECLFGKEAAQEYLIGIRKNIENTHSMQGVYGVHNEGSTDMYYKGANMWGTLRTIINDDELWWQTLREFSAHFRHQVVSKTDVIHFFEKQLKRKLTPFFEQYISHSKIPSLEYKLNKKGELLLRWAVDVKRFQMPVELELNREILRIDKVKTKWKNTKLTVKNIKELKFDTNTMYIRQISPF